MKAKVFCPVCLVSFLSDKSANNGDVLTCPVCGSKLEVTVSGQEVIEVRRFPQEPKDEIIGRIETFAKQRNLVFNEDKETVIEGLLQKQERFGDFYCPCKFDNISENVCPCLETRMGEVTKSDHCY